MLMMKRHEEEGTRVDDEETSRPKCCTVVYTNQTDPNHPAQLTHYKTSKNNRQFKSNSLMACGTILHYVYYILFHCIDLYLCYCVALLEEPQTFSCAHMTIKALNVESTRCQNEKVGFQNDIMRKL